MGKFLTKKDVELLTKWGYPNEELAQIEECVHFCWLTDKDGKRISRKRAIELLGREQFLSGLSRAAFHWSAERSVYGTDETVGFDCSRYFR